MRERKRMNLGGGEEINKRGFMDKEPEKRKKRRGRKENNVLAGNGRKRGREGEQRDKINVQEKGKMK